jgi:hypothetical protein
MIVAQHTLEALPLKEAAARIAEALEIAKRGAPSWMTVHFGPAVDVAGLFEALVAAGAIGAGTSVQGGGSCLGVMGPDSAKIGAGDGVGVFAVWDDLGDYGTFSADSGDDPRAAGARAALGAIERAGRPGEVPGLFWVTATPGCEEAIIAGIEEATGRGTPILGGSADDNDVTGAWRIFSRGMVHSEGVVVSALFPSAPLAQGFQSGRAPIGQSGVATRVDGRRIIEIDGKPARTVYEKWARHVLPVADPGEDVPVLSASTWAPLGLCDAWRRRVEERASGALIVFCGGSMLAMKDDMPKVVGGLNEVSGDIPFLGTFTLGEQGRNDGHDGLIFTTDLPHPIVETCLGGATGL